MEPTNKISRRFAAFNRRHDLRIIIQHPFCSNYANFSHIQLHRSSILIFMILLAAGDDARLISEEPCHAHIGVIAFTYSIHINQCCHLPVTAIQLWILTLCVLQLFVALQAGKLELQLLRGGMILRFSPRMDDTMHWLSWNLAGRRGPTSCQISHWSRHIWRFLTHQKTTNNLEFCELITS